MDFMEKKKNKKDYRGFIGPADKYENIGEIVFNLCKDHGLQKNHKFLDIGAGSLRVGKHLIPWLHKNKYKAIEPEEWLIGEALCYELPDEIMLKKNPEFSFNKDFIMDFAGEKIDFILANSIFIHTSQDQIKQCLLNAKEKMHEGSIMIFNFIPGKNNTKKEWTYPGAVKYQMSTIVNILRGLGFDYELISCNYPGKQVFLKISLMGDE
jgi:hypothetical protein